MMLQRWGPGAQGKVQEFTACGRGRRMRCVGGSVGSVELVRRSGLCMQFALPDDELD